MNNYNQVYDQILNNYNLIPDNLMNNQNNPNNLINPNNPNNLINPNNPNNPNNEYPVHVENNQTVTIFDLFDDLENTIDRARMKFFILTSIDVMLYNSSPPNAQFSNDFVNNMNNAITQMNNMIIDNINIALINKILNILNQCNRDQQKNIYNLLSALF